MRNTIYGLVAAASLFAGVVRGADSPSPTAYQSAVRTVLTERGWSVTSDKAGELIAERPSINNQDETRNFVVGGTLDKRVRLRIDFQRDDQGQVATSAFTSISYYNRTDPYIVGQSQFRSFAFHSPKLTQEYLDIMAEAKTGTAAHRHAQADGGNQRKVALK